MTCYIVKNKLNVLIPLDFNQYLCWKQSFTILIAQYIYTCNTNLKILREILFCIDLSSIFEAMFIFTRVLLSKITKFENVDMAHLSA